VGLDPFGQGLFHNVLDGGVQGELQGRSVDRDARVGLFGAQQAPFGIPGCHHFPRLASQLGIEDVFDAQLAQAIDIGKAHDLAGQAAPRVEAFALRQEIDPVQFEGADGCHLAGRELPFEIDERLLEQQLAKNEGFRHL